MVRLGEDLVVRLPRRRIAIELLEHELSWLPRIAAARQTGVLARGQAEAAAVVVKEGLEAPAHGGPAVWVHGDPRTGNTVLGPDGPALVDWGDLTAGDPRE
mgnify:CR=1 FL=1